MGGLAKILVIDDEKVVRTGCVRILANQGYDVKAAESGEEGLALFEKQEFDLVITDIMMPGMDGMEVLRMVRRRKPHVGAIIISGYATVAKAVETMKLGAADFLPKPFLPEQLVLSVKQALASRNFDLEVATLREQAETGVREILAEQSRIKAIIQCMEEGVIVTDRDRTVLLHNAAAQKMIRLPEKGLVGETLPALLECRLLLQQIERSMESRLALSIDLPAGEISDRFLRARSAPVVSGEAETLLGSVTVFEDITSLKEMDRMKSEFVAMVSHELKAPLSTIQQMIYFLSDGKLGPVNESQTQILQRAQVRLSELLDLVKNLLELSRIESSSFHLDMEPVLLGPLVRACLAESATAAETKNIELHFSEDPDVHPVLGDERNLQIVIKNLVGNAIKYTIGGGQVFVDLKNNNRHVILTVRDTGIGILPEELPKIFEKFYRVKDEKARWVTGTGLGLSITKTIVESHQGRIEVESAYGVGTRFTVLLPGLVE